MAIEIVDFPMENGDFPLQTVSSPEGKPIKIYGWNVEISTESMSETTHLGMVYTDL